MNHTILTGNRSLSLASTRKPKPWSWGEKIFGQGDCILESGVSERDYHRYATSVSVLGSLWSNSLGSEGINRRAKEKEEVVLL